MKTLTRKGYARLYVDTEEDIERLRGLIKELDAFEFEYLPDDLIATFDEPVYAGTGTITRRSEVSSPPDTAQHTHNCSPGMRTIGSGSASGPAESSTGVSMGKTVSSKYPAT